ncbi:MAG: methyltransferase [Rhodobacter sp.]|nr:methyltransferase [Paracoccaceae bacterium]MCC0080496.1 methyltransferase [Rhodobacter sp.]
MTDAPAEVTRDVFLGGALSIVQPRTGYRAATDPILLAAAVAALPGQSVLELGCGVGVALLALGRRVPGLDLVGVERMAGYAELAQRNAAANGIAAQITCADLVALPAQLRRAFDHVLINPPYYPPTAPAAADPGRAAALREETPLALWVEVAMKRLRPGGYLTMIHLAERLPAILAALDGRAGAIAVRPLAPRAGRDAGRVLVRARKGARGPFRLLAPLVMHDGDRHRQDGDDFTPAAQAVLRDGAALSWT